MAQRNHRNFFCFVFFPFHLLFYLLWQGLKLSLTALVVAKWLPVWTRLHILLCSHPVEESNYFPPNLEYWSSPSLSLEQLGLITFTRTNHCGKGLKLFHWYEPITAHFLINGRWEGSILLKQHSSYPKRVEGWKDAREELGTMHNSIHSWLGYSWVLSFYLQPLFRSQPKKISVEPLYILAIGSKLSRLQTSSPDWGL